MMEKNTEPFRTGRRPLSTERVRRPRLFLLFLSLSLNLGLLLFLAGQLRPPAVITATPDSATRETGRILKVHSQRVAHAALPWSQLESADLALYAANLRAAGCPPKTVRDILLPLIEEKFAHPESSDAEPISFWASFSQRQAAAAAKAKKESAVDQQKFKTIQDLLGFTWNSDGIKQSCDWKAVGALGFLDYESAEKFLCVAERFKQQFTLATGSQHRIDRRFATYQALRQEAGEILSPAELDEAELRGVLMLDQLRNPNLCKVGLSGSELRQLMIFRRELCNPLPTMLFAKSDELIPQDSAAEEQFHTKVRTLLGDNRFLSYLKNCDASIERTMAALAKEHLPENFALQLFDFRREAIARAEAIRQLPVSRAEKRAQLAALRQNALEQLADLSESPLLKINQDWLQEIARP